MSDDEKATPDPDKLAEIIVDLTERVFGPVDPDGRPECVKMVFQHLVWGDDPVMLDCLWRAGDVWTN